MNIIYEGSTKNILKDQERIVFHFKDDYSIFDWGKMPDELDNKGFYLCQIGGHLFEYLHDNGIKTHMKSYFNRTMDIEYFDKNEFINLEVIFRFGVPDGSSLLKRGYQARERFEYPLVEFTTKRESLDRLIDDHEACKISKLSIKQLENLKKHTIKIAQLLKSLFESKKILLWDGKFEFAFKNNEFYLTDSIGLDELRLSTQNQYFSKELLRKYYKRSLFFNEINEHKDEYNKIKKDIIKNQPKKLPNNIKKHMENMYQSLYRLLCKNNNSHLKEWVKKNKLIEYNQKVVVFGDGGREHAIANKISQSPFVKSIYIHTKRKNIFNDYEDIYFDETNEFINFCQNEKIDLVVIGPEAPLCEGIANQLREKNIPVVGPDKFSSQLESSKIFTKKFLQYAQIKSAKSESFKTYEQAKLFIQQSLWENFVIKIDGLAAGKGVAVCDNAEIAQEELDKLNQNFPNQRYLIEEKLEGKEVSLFYIIDENEIKYLGEACDYKTLLNDNKGPNTGGMGTYSPCDWIGPDRIEKIQSELKSKIKDGLYKMNIKYNGILFVGLMVTEEDYNVLEFNIRFGDPETQVLLPRINEDLYLLLKQCAHNALDDSPISFKDKSFVHVVCTSKNYPYAISEKTPITVKQFDKETEFILAGVEKDGDRLLASGGRVCGVTAMGMNKLEARTLAYRNIKNIDYKGIYYRGDIAN